MWKKLRTPLGYLLIFGCVLFCGLVTLTVIAVRYDGDPYLGQVTRADGTSRLRLLQVVEGPLEYKWTPPLFQRFIPTTTPYVPAFEVKLSGRDRWTDAPGVSFLFRTVDAQGHYSNPPGMSPEFEFVEASGFVFKDRGNMPDFPHWGTSGLTRSAIPRRDKDLHIRIIDSPMGKKQVLEMVIPNPVFRESFPVWLPESFPIKKSNGPLTVRLVGLDYRYEQVVCQWESDTTEEDWKNPSFSYLLEDATGNVGQMLSPFEPTWKIKANAFRSNKASFPKEVSQVLEKLPVKAPGTVTPFDRTFDVDGIPCRLICVAGAGKVTDQEGVLTAEVVADSEQASMLSVDWGTKGAMKIKVTRAKPFVWIELLKPLPKDAYLVSQVSSDSVVHECPLGTMGVGDRSFVVAEIPDVGGVTEVDLTFSVSRPLEFEFLVTPPDAARTSDSQPDRR